ncbi:enolase C-terminal domain-like protein [Chengkuizengella axinellae]|uniref:glucarate dehydratase n=1 Tax=Chengkuizengella axinellae TaxID=3064388 RepID=A0ABT9IXH5_9BACL|nr:enolase C-terminal domain-like protein [Chengkuizengella sp. 2205SS18-9]MDP5274057.1 enolase C-terminal domain-like protein [Chengkuizengella sp. 2205SS18-9]
MKIVDIRPTTVTVPLEAPLRHSNGVHWGRFVRTIIEVETDEGIVGLGEMGGGGESAELAFLGLKEYLIGHNPFELEALRFKICNPTASLYNNRTQMLAAIEFACLDIIGKKLSIPVYDLLGGKLRDSVSFASYLFFRYPNEKSGLGKVETNEELIQHALDLKEKYGFTSHKLKGGVFDPLYELECYKELAKALPDDSYRFDPNAALSVEQSIKFAKEIELLNNDYFEDPTWGLNGLRRVRENTNLSIATNTVVVNFEQLSQNILNQAVDVILLDTTFWGGIRQCIKAAAVCETFQLGVAVHSSGELGIQLATMLHLGAVLPNISFSIDAHYHHLTDDIIKGGKMEYKDGKMKIPNKPGLGIEIDQDKLGEYSELYQTLGGYPYDRDYKRPDWFPLLPNDRWAALT